VGVGVQGGVDRVRKKGVKLVRASSCIIQRFFPVRLMTVGAGWEAEDAVEADAKAC
jgi:hypothetical protein